MTLATNEFEPTNLTQSNNLIQFERRNRKTTENEDYHYQKIKLEIVILIKTLSKYQHRMNESTIEWAIFFLITVDLWWRVATRQAGEGDNSNSIFFEN